jgi:hypothetical protein
MRIVSDGNRSVRGDVRPDAASPESILAARSDARIWRQFSAEWGGGERVDEHWRQILARLAPRKD